MGRAFLLVLFCSVLLRAALSTEVQTMNAADPSGAMADAATAAGNDPAAPVREASAAVEDPSKADNDEAPAKESGKEADDLDNSVVSSDEVEARDSAFSETNTNSPPDTGIPEGDIDDTGADSELRELRAKVKKKSGLIKKQKAELSELVAENKAEDARQDAVKKGIKGGDASKGFKWADASASNDNASTEELEKQAEKLLQPQKTQEEKDQEATKGGSNAVALAKEEADKIIAAARSKAEKQQISAKKELMAAEAEANTEKANAKKEAAEIEQSAEADAKQKEENAKILVAAAKAEAQEAAKNATNKIPADAEVEGGTQDFSKGLGTKPTLDQVAQEKAKLAAEKAEIDKMQDSPEKTEKLLELKKKAEKLMELAKLATKTEAQAEADSKENQDSVNAESEPGKETSKEKLSDKQFEKAMSKAENEADKEEGKESASAASTDHKAVAEKVAKMVTPQSMKDVKGLAAKMAKSLQEETATSPGNKKKEESVLGREPTKADKDNANMDKKNFLRQTKRDESTGMVAGVKIPPI